MRSRIRRIATIASAVVVALVPTSGVAGAHPLGNFTVNTSASLIVRADEVAIAYVVDMAEVPAFREQRTIDVDADGSIATGEAEAYTEATCAALADGLEVTIAGERSPVRVRDAGSVGFPQGAGGLTTLRLECDLVAASFRSIRDGQTARLTFADANHAEALGWREVSAAGDGVTVERSDVPRASETDALRNYPTDALPLNLRTATIDVRGGGPSIGSGSAAIDGGGRTDGTVDGGVLASLVGRADLTPGLVALMVLIALGVGALHALGPGHGKALIGAYLIGGTGTIRHAVGVGAAVSLMHTASVLVLGAVVLGAEKVFPPERVYPWLGLAAGALALTLGSSMLRSRWRIHRASGFHQGIQDHPDHTHHPPAAAHTHTGQHGHGSVSSRGLLALAFTGGALPSPTALVVFLATVSIGRAALGLTLIAAFSAGLAATLIGVGVLALKARGMAERRLSSGLMRWVPLGSASAIVALGLLLAIRAFSQL